MTELSFFWGGTSTGDATEAPYNDDEFSDLWCLLHQYDREYQGVIYTLYDGAIGETLASADLSGLLEVTNPAGTTIRVAPGAAIVDGKLYVNDGDLDDPDGGVATPGAGDTYYYTVVLQKDFSAQEVRCKILGPNTSAPTPSVTQTDGTTWEIELAYLTVDDGGNVNVTDKRRMCGPVPGLIRYSGSRSACVAGFDNEIVSVGHSFIGGGIYNEISGSAAAIVGGSDNEITASKGFIGGGEDNAVTGIGSAIVGGQNNTVGGVNSTARGARCTADGDYSWSGGRRADDDSNDGVFIWADSEDAAFTADRADQFKVRCSGGAHFVQNTSDAALPVMTLEQEDTDEPFLKVIGDAAAADLDRNIVDEGDQGSETAEGWIKVEVLDDGNQITDGDYFIRIYSLSA